MPRRIITEEELREAAREVLEYELAVFDSYNHYPDHIFRGKFRLNMAALIHEVKRGAVKAAKYSMGFTYYAKRCMAAVLLIFTLSCIAMPEAVLAGYQKLIEVIETVFEDYTEYRYRVNDDGGIEETFKPLKLGYLPEGMELVNERKTVNNIKQVYQDKNNKYLVIQQKLILCDDNITYILDGENIIEENIREDAKLVKKENEIYFIIVSGKYRIIGQTNLSKAQVTRIVEIIK